MIILFLKYYSYRMAHDAAAKEKAEAAAKAAAEAETRDIAIQTDTSISGALITESLG